MSIEFARPRPLPDPAQVGPYRILERIGDGGMGVVYAAEQQQPHRRVALKVIKPGMDTNEVLARFEGEHQALALMDHPGIAKIHDAGVTPEGRPYFVMEYVPGVPLTAYCDREKLSVITRVELMIAVCRAVHHAHQKGIIHRDLKPSNVLVTLQDGKPTPKTIDFGLAKVTRPRLAEHAFQTRPGQIVGTPAYMSPEQAEGPGVAVDVRSDVYSLGVMLYELLCGALPFDSQALRVAGENGLARVLREVDPPKPSKRVLLHADRAGLAASNRATDRGTLIRRLTGDLDWITMKALESDRNRRYQSVSELAEDLQRHLACHPVAAAPPGRAYQLRKFVRRHRAASVSACFALVSLVGGLVVATHGLREEAKRSHDLELVVGFQERQLAGVDVPALGILLRGGVFDGARASSTRANHSVQETAERLEHLEQLLGDVDFTDLARSTVEELVFGRSLEVVEREFSQQPTVQAGLYQVVASTLRRLGLLERALEPQKRALELNRRILGSEDPRTMNSISNMGVLLEAMGKPEEAEPYYREALESRRRVLGDRHRDTLTSLNNMGYLLGRRGRYEAAEAHYQEALDGCRRFLGDEHPDTLRTINNFGLLLREQGRYDLAERYLREAFEGRRRINGEGHRDTLLVTHNLGFLLQAQGKVDEAELYLRRSFDGCRQLLSEDHPETLVSLQCLGVVLLARGQLDDAERCFRQALASQRRTLTRLHPESLTTMCNLGVSLKRQGKYQEAEEYYREALDGRRRVLPPDHIDTLASIGNLGVLLKVQGKLAEAEPYYREALEGKRRVLDEDHPDTLAAINNLGLLLIAQGKRAAAEPYLREALAARRKKLEAEHPDTLLLADNLADLLRAEGEFVEAERLFRETLKGRRRVLEDHADTIASMTGLAKLLEHTERRSEAVALRAAAVEMGKRKYGPRDRKVGDLLVDHGRTCAELAQYASASTALEEAYSIFVEKLEARHERVVKLVPQLVSCFEAWHQAAPDGGHGEIAEVWRSKLVELSATNEPTASPGK